jgi:LysR family transcriptional regulator, transcriptional activator for bauABCD operon
MSRFQLSNPDIRHLRMLIAIVEHGGMSAAATEASVSLASISRSLTALEARFGVRLCNRGRAGFQLTPQGREVYEAAKSLVSDVADFENAVFNVTRLARGKVRLGIIDNVLSNPSSPVHPAIGLFHEKYPDVYLELTILPKPMVESAVRDASIDVGIVGDPFFFNALKYLKYAEEHHYLYVARDSEIYERLRQGAKLSELPYIRRRYKAFVFEKVERRHDLRATATAGSLEGVAILVAAGVGLGILPSHYVDRLPHLSLHTVPIADMPLVSTFHVVHRPQVDEEILISELVRLLNETAPRARPRM